MFECKLAKASQLKKIVEAIRELVTDAPFDCSETDITLQGMDGSHVALVSMKLGMGLFDVFRCDRGIQLGLSLKSLGLALKFANNDDGCTLRFEDDTTDSIMCIFEDEKHSKKQDITLKLMDIDAEALGVPDQKYKAVVELSSAEFKKIVGDLIQVGDTVTINAVKGQLTFEANGDQLSNVVTLSSNEEIADDDDEDTNKDENRVSISVEEAVKLSFSCKYLNMFAKATPLSSRVRLSLSNGVPVVVEYRIGEEVNDTESFLKFYLAPKIDEENDNNDDNMDDDA